MLAVDRDVGATVEKGRAVGLEDSGSWFSHFLEAKVVRRWHLPVTTVGGDVHHDGVFLVVKGPGARHLRTSDLQMNGDPGWASSRRCEAYNLFLADPAGGRDWAQGHLLVRRGLPPPGFSNPSYFFCCLAFPPTHTPWVWR